MNRRQFIISSSAVALGLGGKIKASGYGGLAGAAISQAPASTPPVTRFEELRRGVGIFIGTGGTIGYLVNADGAIAVDSQFMNTATICVEGLKTLAPKGLQTGAPATRTSRGGVEMLINTHHHGDHTGGNKAFRPLVKTIVCHENCLAWHKKVAEQANTVADQAFADIAFGGSWSSNFGDEKVWARYFGPGHTSGDAVIHFEKANVVHGGDLLFRRVHPRIDGPAGASAVNWIKILERLAKDHGNDTIFVFGHGENSNVRGNKTDVLFFRDYLSAGVDHVRKGISAKKSKEEITRIAALPKFESVIAFNPRLTLEATLGSIYDELSK